ncbi:MAG: lipocalin-like domain protein [Sphingomonas bacterium]|uniref:lipocalin-like domain-containing protein n=1 Tax=Sphingomonas bacterium TaxID=1895847 RepID=UPI00260280C2|nr:lipocalin-like domain-containing protein [Sphingomonas bacterium]MDB5710999.1 lipocalin-like domain protein [Sphingomonas bacterium]
MKHRFVSACAVAALLTGVAVAAQPQPADLASLEGTWVMDSAYEIHPDGTRSTNYGEHPLGLLNVDSAGRYNLQIFKAGRSAFASGDKTRGTPDEYRQAVLGSSTHFGSVAIDRAKHQLVFDVRAASFPNWEGKRQLRDYTFKDGVLSYAVPAGASGNGVVAYSVWRRVAP